MARCVSVVERRLWSPKGHEPWKAVSKGYSVAELRDIRDLATIGKHPKVSYCKPWVGCEDCDNLADDAGY